MASSSSDSIDGAPVPVNPVAASNSEGSIPQQGPPADVAFTPLDELTAGGDFSIRVLICRSWEVKNPAGRYIGTEYIVSDDKGNMLHVIARNTIAHCVVPKLFVGDIYHIRRFTVAPNKDLYRLRKNDNFLIYLEGNSVILKLDCTDAGFIRHPFDVTNIGEIVFNKNEYLIDVVGRVCNLGLCRPAKNGNHFVEFQLTDASGCSIKVSLWGAVAAELSSKASQLNDVYVVLLPAMNVRDYKGSLQLSSTAGTKLFDDNEIPVIAALLLCMRTKPVEPQQNIGTLLELLHLGRQQHGVVDADSIAFICNARINRICPGSPWNYSSCGEKGCKKGLIPVGTDLFCSSCEKICQYPLLRYRLRLEVCDSTTTLVVTLFDDIVEGMVKKSAAALLAETQESDDAEDYPHDIMQLVGADFAFELKSHTYYNHGTYESFTVTRVVCTPSPKKVLQQSEAAVEGSISHTVPIQVDQNEIDDLTSHTSAQVTPADTPTNAQVVDDGVTLNPLKRKLGINIKNGN